MRFVVSTLLNHGLYDLTVRYTVNDKEIVPTSKSLESVINTIEKVTHNVVRNVVKFEALRELERDPAVLDVFHHVYLHDQLVDTSNSATIEKVTKLLNILLVSNVELFNKLFHAS